MDAEDSGGQDLDWLDCWNFRNHADRAHGTTRGRTTGSIILIWRAARATCLDEIGVFCNRKLGRRPRNYVGCDLRAQRCALRSEASFGPVGRQKHEQRQKNHAKTRPTR